MVQAGRHRQVQLGSDSFACDRSGKDRMRRELITVGRLLREFESLIREWQQGVSAAWLERSTHVYCRAVLGQFPQARLRVGREPRQLIEINRNQLVARRERRRNRGPVRGTDLDLEAAQAGNASDRGRGFRTITYQPALWLGQTGATWTQRQRRPRRFETRFQLHVAHWNPVALPAPAMALFEAAV